MLAGDDVRYARMLHVAQHVRIPHIIAEARRMSEEMAQCDRPLRRTQLRRAVSGETFQHPGRCEIGQQVADRFIEIEPPLLDKLHRRR